MKDLEKIKVFKLFLSVGLSKDLIILTLKTPILGNSDTGITNNTINQVPQSFFTSVEKAHAHLQETLPSPSNLPKN